MTATEHGYWHGEAAGDESRQPLASGTVGLETGAERAVRPPRQLKAAHAGVGTVGPDTDGQRTAGVNGYGLSLLIDALEAAVDGQKEQSLRILRGDDRLREDESE